jgi:hypothetical protein
MGEHATDAFSTEQKIETEKEGAIVAHSASDMNDGDQEPRTSDSHNERDKRYNI